MGGMAPRPPQLQRHRPPPTTNLCSPKPLQIQRFQVADTLEPFLPLLRERAGVRAVFFTTIFGFIRRLNQSIFPFASIRVHSRLLTRPSPNAGRHRDVSVVPWPDISVAP